MPFPLIGGALARVGAGLIGRAIRGIRGGSAGFTLPPIQGAGLPVRIPTTTAQLSAPFRLGQAIGRRLRGPGAGQGASTSALAGPTRLRPTTLRPTNIPAGSFRRAGLLTDGRRRRRINPLNPKALRRAVRRLAGFQTFAIVTQRALARLAPRRSRSRSSPFKRRRR